MQPPAASRNVVNACPGCGGGPGGCIKTGRSAELQWHAKWCPCVTGHALPNVYQNTGAQRDRTAVLVAADMYRKGFTIAEIAAEVGFSGRQVRWWLRAWDAD
jgi:hypothetical protein